MATLREYLLTQPREYEFELVHKEEEHDIATFVENPIHAFNDIMLVPFADVLDAPIEFLMGSKYYISIWDVDPQRVEKFQFACAGYIGSIDWDAAYIEEPEEYSVSDELAKLFDYIEYDHTLSSDQFETFIHRHSPMTIQFDKKNQMLNIDPFNTGATLSKHEVVVIAAAAEALGWLEHLPNFIE